MTKRYLTFCFKVCCTSLFLLLTYWLPAQPHTKVTAANSNHYPPLQQLPKGIYFVNVYVNERKQVHKLVVQQILK